jgi:hypothetical protein
MRQSAPSQLLRLTAAYEEALRALHISDRDDPINKVIAQRIIEGARAGVRDPIALCHRWRSSTLWYHNVQRRLIQNLAFNQDGVM